MSSRHLALDIASVYLVDGMADPKIPHSEKTTSGDSSFITDGSYGANPAQQRAMVDTHCERMERSQRASRPVLGTRMPAP
jgi:hypothetical protein